MQSLLTTGEDFVRPKVLPRALVAARDRTRDPLWFLDLDRRARRALAALVTHLRLANPTAPVFASNTVLAAEAQMTVRTLDRALSDLRAFGYIAGDQAHRRSGRFSTTHRRLTDKALWMLGLSEGEDAGTEKPAKPQMLAKRSVTDIHSPPNATMADGHIPNPKPLHLPSEEHPKGKSSQSESESSRAQSQFRFPAELEPLLSNGLQPKQLAKLMATARGHGHRLSDVVAYIGDAWRKHTGRELFAYLQSLAQRSFDFAWQIRLRANKKAHEAAQREQSASMMAALDRLKGSWLRCQRTGTIAYLNPNSAVLEGRTIAGYTVSQQVTPRLAQAVAAGEWAVCDAPRPENPPSTRPPKAAQVSISKTEPRRSLLQILRETRSAARSDKATTSPLNPSKQQLAQPASRHSEGQRDDIEHGARQAHPNEDRVGRCERGETPRQAVRSPLVRELLAMGSRLPFTRPAVV